MGDTAALGVVPEFIGLTVRAASGHGWDDRGEKSKRDEEARNESHFEMRVGKRVNRALYGGTFFFVLWVYKAWLARHRECTPRSRLTAWNERVAVRRGTRPIDRPSPRITRA